MVLKRYGGGKILAPLKCGTRYLDEVFGVNYADIDLSELMSDRNIQTIVLREPYEHLESALHTELLGVWNGEGDVESVLKRFVSGSTHWSPHLYETLYTYCAKSGWDIKVIHLTGLSTYLKSTGVNEMEYNPKKYDFNHYTKWVSKKDMVLYIKENYPDMWYTYMLQVEKSNMYYDSLVNGKYKNKKML